MNLYKLGADQLETAKGNGGPGGLPIRKIAVSRLREVRYWCNTFGNAAFNSGLPSKNEAWMYW